MRHVSRVRRAVSSGLMVASLAGFAFAYFAFAGPATAAPTTTTVETHFGITGDCGSGVIFCYLPSTVTVSVGDTVQWTDLSGFDHTITRCDPEHCSGAEAGTGSDAPLDGVVAPGQDFSHTFTGPGTYVYYCQFHGYGAMNGTITVAEESSSTTVPPTSSPTSSPKSTPTSSPTSSPETTTPTAVAPAAAAAASATANSTQFVDPAVTREPLARTGSNLRLVAIGLSVAGLGVALVSAEHLTRRSRTR